MKNTGNMLPQSDEEFEQWLRLEQAILEHSLITATE